MYAGRLLPIRIVSDPLTGAGVTRPARGPRWITHSLGEFGGLHRITGTVKRAPAPGTPVSKRVRLLSRRDWQVVAEVWSDPITGAYAFDWLAPDRDYLIVVVDDAGVYNPKAVIPDAASIVPMP